jgi:SAM-dependent methyltransferase
MNRDVSIFDDVLAPAPRYLSRLALLQELIETLPGEVESFLEIGPGMGDVSSFLSARYPNASGTMIEFSGTGAAILRRRFASHDRLSVIEQDIREMPAERTFDLIVACEVLEHIENDTEVLKQIAQRLSPNGHFLFSAPAFMSKWQSVDTYAGHFRRYERAELVEKFPGAGLAIEKLWIFGFPICTLLYPLREAYYAVRVRSAEKSKEEATKESGVDRALARRFRWFPLTKVLWPFFVMQRLAKNTNMGDGFLVLAKRSER